MLQELELLLRELKTKKILEVNGDSLPDEDTIEKIGQLGDVSVVPALEEALEQAQKLEAMAFRLRENVNPSAAGSASPMIAELSARQTAGKIRDAISKCKGRTSLRRSRPDVNISPGQIVDLRSEAEKHIV